MCVCVLWWLQPYLSTRNCSTVAVGRVDTGKVCEWLAISMQHSPALTYPITKDTSTVDDNIESDITQCRLQHLLHAIVTHVDALNKLGYLHSFDRLRDVRVVRSASPDETSLKDQHHVCSKNRY